jgi:hypothetical protein
MLFSFCQVVSWLRLSFAVYHGATQWGWFPVSSLAVRLTVWHIRHHGYLPTFLGPDSRRQSEHDSGKRLSTRSPRVRPPPFPAVRGPSHASPLLISTCPWTRPVLRSTGPAHARSRAPGKFTLHATGSITTSVVSERLSYIGSPHNSGKPLSRKEKPDEREETNDQTRPRTHDYLW